MIQELWDKESIRQCLNRYARGVDRFDRDIVLSPFHSDAIDEHGKSVGSPSQFIE
jgi:SnoaL-like domain